MVLRLVSLGRCCADVIGSSAAILSRLGQQVIQDHSYIACPAWESDLVSFPEAFCTGLLVQSCVGLAVDKWVQTGDGSGLETDGIPLCRQGKPG